MDTSLEQKEKTRFFTVLDLCPQLLATTQKKTLDFIKSYPRIFRRELGINLMRLDTEAFLKAVPEAQLALDPLGVKITEAFTFVMWHFDQCGIHRDNGPLKARINFPILNGKNTYTYFYEEAETITITNAAGGHVAIAKDQSIPHADFVETVCPIALKVLELHKVMVPHNNPMPRITLSMRTYPDPVFLIDR
jgi:hypothetical protein